MHRRSLIPLVVLIGVLASWSAQGLTYKQLMRFAADMARAGNMKEARYRWELAREQRPDNPHVLNNLAVAAESLGDPGKARALYAEALASSSADPRIHDNYRRFERYLEQTEQAAALDGKAVDVATADGKKTGKIQRITVSLTVPPRLALGDRRRLLVASFRADESTLIDTNREFVRFLRAEFTKHTTLEVVDVVPPPAIPEQTLQDLLANGEFWRHLGREYDADLIVSGIVYYTRDDASGFEDVDVVSSTTGQKVRETRFIEREEFIYAIDVLFMDGATGELLFRDRLQRSTIFRGAQNDPITAFYQLSEAVAGDILGVVNPRVRRDTRAIFKN